MNIQGFIQDFFVGGGGGGGGGGTFFFIAGETIDHSEGEGVGGCGRGVCSLPCCIQRRNLLFDILFLTVRFTLWTNKGNAIISATGTATFY